MHLTRDEKDGSNNHDDCEHQPSDEQQNDSLIRTAGFIFECFKRKTRNYITQVASDAISVAYNVWEKQTTLRMWETSEAPILSPYPLPPYIFISHGHVNVDVEGVGDILFPALYTIKLHIKGLLNWSIIKPFHIFSPSSGSVPRIWQNTWTLHIRCQKSPLFPTYSNQCAPRHFQLPPPREVKSPQIHNTAEPHNAGKTQLHKERHWENKSPF